MRQQSKDRIVRVSFGVLVAGLPACSPFLSVQSQARPRDKQWRVKYEEGDAPFAAGQQLLFSVSEQAIVGCDAKTRSVSLSVPASAVTEVSYDTKAWSASRAVLRMVNRSAKCCEDGTPADLFRAYVAITAVLMGLAVLPATLPIRGRNHFVHIVWEQHGIPKRVSLRVRKNDRGAILTELGRVSGKQWKNVPLQRRRLLEQRKRETQRVYQEQEKLRPRLNRARDKTARVWIHQAVQLGGAELAPGLYRLVLVEGGRQRGELYFFSKKVDPHQIAAAALVEIDPAPSESVFSRVQVQRQPGGPATVSRVIIFGNTLRVLGSLGPPGSVR